MGVLTRAAQGVVDAVWGLTNRRMTEKALAPAYGGRGWLPIIHEPFTGAWQRNREINVDTAVNNPTVYACATLISGDIGKLGLRLVEKDSNGVWNEIPDNPAYSPVLRKPNRYQTRIDFYMNWVMSKLLWGNTYVLKERDNRNVVTAMYILDPSRVRVLVSDDGTVFYQLNRDNLSGQAEETIVAPASEIIHDKMYPLFHPLVGVSPIIANGLAALAGVSMMRNSVALFENFARPAGIITSATALTDEKAKQFQEQWDQRYGRGGIGGTAILGGGWTYAPMSMSAVDAQLIDQLKWSAETICSCFHVPPYMIGVAAAPTYNNIEALNQNYYGQCLQLLIEQLEALLDEGLGLGPPYNRYGTEFDREDLLLMDSATRADVAQKSIIGGGMSPNEARKRFYGLGPVKGGDSPYLQQQQFSLSALAERDQSKPFAKPAAPPPAASAPTPSQETEEENADGGDEQRAAYASEIYHRAAQFDARDAA
jgi:HK97 family phage portal protein